MTATISATISAATSNPTAGDGPTARLAGVLRDIARGGIATVLAGVIVGGLGGRLVMRLAAILNPQATGLHTDSGEVVGAISANGTLALIFFGGLLVGGVVAGVVWVIVSPWLPGHGLRRVLLAAIAAVALGASFLVRSGTGDFRILREDALLMVLLVGLVAGIGAMAAWLDQRLERALPRAGRNPWPILVAYGLIAALGSLGLVVAIGAYFSIEGCGCARPPVPVGWALVVVGVATVTAWVGRITSDVARTRPPVQAAGRIALGLAVLLGLVHLAGEAASILAQA